MGQQRVRLGVLGAALFAVTTAGWAQQDQTGVPTGGGTPQAGAQTPAKKPEVAETVTVTATGEVRSEPSVSSEALLEAAPGTSPIETLARLPSVTVQTADPYGAYEWALRISVRGFNQNQLGFTLDDVPLGICRTGT